MKTDDDQIAAVVRIPPEEISEEMTAAQIVDDLQLQKYLKNRMLPPPTVEE